MSAEEIRLERQLLEDQGLEMRRREEYHARQTYTSDRDCDRIAQAFFLHIAVVDDPGDLVGTEDEVARNIEAIGQSRFGSGWSYNAAAFNTGRLYEGQPLHRRGTHTVNTFQRHSCETHGGSLEAPHTSDGFNNNINARALVLPQQVDDQVTDEQLHAAARWAAAQKRAGLATAGARWHGHRCVTAKACPGDRAFLRIHELQQLTDHYTENGLTDMLSKDDIAAIADATAAATTRRLLDAEVGDDGPNVRTALRRAARGPELADQLADRIIALLEQMPADDGVTADDAIKAAVKQALREGTGE